MGAEVPAPRSKGCRSSQPGTQSAGRGQEGALVGKPEIVTWGDNGEVCCESPGRRRGFTGDLKAWSGLDTDM